MPVEICKVTALKLKRWKVENMVSATVSCNVVLHGNFFALEVLYAIFHTSMFFVLFIFCNQLPFFRCFMFFMICMQVDST